MYTYTCKGILLEYRDLDKNINLPLWLCLWDEHVKRNEAKRTILFNAIETPSSTGVVYLHLASDASHMK